MMLSANNSKAIVTEIQRFAVHDGPGIRTLVFLKGCPLRCLWCCNPETLIPKLQLAYTRAKCLGCGNCVATCEVQALELTSEGLRIDRQKCNLCGKCVGQCMSEALLVVGQEMSPTEVFQQIMQDAAFYEASGGGVTLSGGEPLTTPEFVKELLRLCKQAGIHTAIETCGYVPWASFEKILPFLDLALFDLKHMDPRQHKQGTGKSNQRILANLGKLDQAGMELIIRVPLIPGFNDSIDNIRRTASLASSLRHILRLDLLPYHRLGKPKYFKLGLKYALEDLTPARAEQIENLRQLVESFGIPTTIGG